MAIKIEKSYQASSLYSTFLHAFILLGVPNQLHKPNVENVVIYPRMNSAILRPVVRLFFPGRYSGQSCKFYAQQATEESLDFSVRRGELSGQGTMLPFPRLLNKGDWLLIIAVELPRA